MKNPNSKSNKINIIFSSFLVIGYIICTYFFSSIASQIAGIGGSLLQILIMVLFGLLLFYATRVGEGKQVKRFSLAVLLLIDLPAFYLIIASLVEGMPLHDYIVPPTTMSMLGVASTHSGPSIILMMACIALGYGIPYTFFSGYEIKEEGEAEAEAEEETVVEGGLAEELAETEKDAEEKADEAVEEASETAEEAAQDAVEETAETAEEAADEATDNTEESEKEAE